MNEGTSNRVDVLVGAKVDGIKFTPQFVEINFFEGASRENKHAYLQIEANFTLKLKGSSVVINTSSQESLPPVLTILNATVKDIQLTSEYELTVTFEDDVILKVPPQEKYEAWNLHGDSNDDLPFYIAQGI